jgi:signal peptidase II
MRLRKYVVPLTAALITAAADQYTKSLVVARMALFEARAVLVDWFHIVHVRNTGVAFGLFAGLDPDWMTPILVTATILAAAAVLFYIHHFPGRGPAPLGLGLILGGAVGNLVDRARYGYVVDFLDVHWRHHHWPAFNVADIGLTAGIALLLLDAFFPSE